MKYDIFISYRRKGGYDTAKHLNDLLVRDGYKVSFDIDTLRNGDFDKQLLTRIEECKDFILIVDEHAFDRTLDPASLPEQDWMRQELAHALKLKKNIIPVFLAGVSGFPNGLPDDVIGVVKKNGPEFNKYYFNDFYKKLKSKFIKSRNHKIWSRVFIGILLVAIVGLVLVFNLKPEEDIIYQNPNLPHITNEVELKKYADNVLEQCIATIEFADSVQMCEQWQKEADSGNAESQYNLGLSYFLGQYKKPDISKSIELIEKSAEQNYAPAMYFIATCYGNGIGLDVDMEKAEAMYLKAAELGFAPAQNDYGVLCSSNGNIKPKESFEWFEKAAMQNYAPAQYNMAYCYVNNVGVSYNLDNAKYWLEKAAEQNLLIAQYNLAYLYLFGPGEYNDLSTAIIMLEDLSERGYAQAMCDLASCYANGYGVDKDLKKSLGLIKVAAEQEYAPAQAMLGFAYINPMDVPVEQNIEKGMDLLKKAAAKGFPQAQYWLGMIYQQGIGGVADAKESQKWFDKAAKQGVTHQTMQNMNNQSNQIK